MTTAHINYDSTKPDGATGTGTTYANDDVNNQRALRDMIIAGLVPGFIQTRTQGTGPDVNRPQFITWNNATLGVGFRWNITWTGQNPTTIQEEWQNDGIPNWLAVGAAQVNTFDGNNNITASTNSGGFVNLVMELWGKLLKVVSDFATHAAATGTAVHGLGTMSPQNSNNVTISGGTGIDGIDIGIGTPGKGNFTRVAEALNTFTPGLNVGVSVDWAKGGSKITTNGTNAITFANVPSGEAGHVVDVSAFNNVTWPGAVDWGAGGIPSIAGRARVVLATNDAGTKVCASVSWS